MSKPEETERTDGNLYDAKETITTALQQSNCPSCWLTVQWR